MLLVVGPCLATSLLGRGGGIAARLLADWRRARPAPLLLLNVKVPVASATPCQDSRACMAKQGKANTIAAGLSGVKFPPAN